MSQPVELNSRCVFIGKGDGHLVHHRVIGREGVSNVTGKMNTWILTWSIYKVDDLESNGWSWYGPIDDFIKQFRPALPSEGI